MIHVRSAAESDISGIREIFAATYGGHYAHPEFCEEDHLKRILFDDDVLLLVAEDSESHRILGTASIILDIGAFGDLLGEFGRLAVHPEGRNQGIGKLLMEARLEQVEDRLHLAVVENRAVHPYSQRISASYGFLPVGFLPSKLKFEHRENVALYARMFGSCLKLRRNHPHVIPEAFPLAERVLQEAGIEEDVIVDHDTAAYQTAQSFDLEAMTSAGYASLLRFERGRVQTRELIGPVKLHAGVFQLFVSHYRYLLARDQGRLVGGIGFHLDTREESARILELVSADSEPVRFLLEEAIRVCREEGGVQYIEVDVNAHAPAMQRTLLELGFLPAAYIPAMCFHRVERLDVLRMVKLFQPLHLEGVALHETTQPVADLVIRSFQQRTVLPRIAEAVAGTALFAGLSSDQATRLASICDLETFEPDETLAAQGVADGRAFLVLSGSATVSLKPNAEASVGTISPGETASELSLLSGHPHAATISAKTPVEAVVLTHDRMAQLIRQRPDIGVIIFQNLARQLGEKLLRADQEMAQKKASS